MFASNEGIPATPTPLLQSPLVRYAAMVMGEHPVVVDVTARDIAELRDFLTRGQHPSSRCTRPCFCRRSSVVAWSPTTAVDHDPTADAGPSRVVVGLVLLVGNLVVPGTAC